MPRTDHVLCKRFLVSSKCTDPSPPPPPHSERLPKLTHSLKSVSSKSQFVCTDDTVPLNSVGNLLQHFQPERRDKTEYSLSLRNRSAHDRWNRPPSAETNTQSHTRFPYLCPSTDSLPKLMQEWISVGPQWTETKFSFESRLVRVLVVLLNTESLLW